MRIKQYIPVFLFLFCSGGLAAQQIELSFPALPNRPALILYAEGHDLDSLSVVLDSKGEAATRSVNKPKIYLGKKEQRRDTTL
jgi:hypothetical protein